ncbi:hypothetical protein Vafri_2278 [Volvox africanus]|nr:hypothetical protein Vafri_2278 [Volvox africanus]
MWSRPSRAAATYLEFVPDLNPGVCGDSLVDLLVGLVAEELHGAFGIRMPLRRSLHQQQQQELREKLELCQKLEQPEQPEGAGLGAAAAGGQQRQEQVLARESGHAGNEVEAQGLWGGGAASLGDGYAGASEVERGPCGDFTAVPGCGGDVNRGSGSDSSVSTSDGSCPWVWELCSTTAAKFSRHLIIRIPHCAFKDNFHVNAFVRRLFDRIAADPIRFGAFFVRRSADPDDSPALFIDPAVYTRNRAFRLYLSSKAGKSAVLRATSRYAVASLLRRRGSVVQTGRVAPSAAIPMRSSNCNCALSRRDLVAAGMAADALEDFCAQVADISATAAVQLPDSAISGGQASVLLPPSVEKEISRDVFLSSLVTGVGRVDRVLKMYDVGSGHSDGAASLVGFHAAADLLSSGPSRAMSSLGIPRLPRPASGHGCATAAPAGCKGPCLAAGAGPHPLRSAAAAPFQYGPSPFPHIDKFIESVCCEGGVQGRVRCWQYLEDTATLLLSMRENRWCANIGRAHRSNGIYFTVDLRGGTWHQRCFDPECRDFRSARMPLPSHLWEECRSRVDERQHEEDEENEAHQPHQQAGPRGMQPTDDGAQESEQLRIPQKRLQDQSRGLALVTAGTHGGSSLCDEDDDPDFDMLCVQALERFERMVASNTTI